MVSDTIRDEGRGKMTLLGFAGILPHVRLYVTDATLPLQLAFVFVAAPGSGKYLTKIRVTKEGDRTPFLQSTAAEGEILPDKTSTNFSYQLIGAFPGAGKYRVELLADDKPQYSSAFELVQGAAPA